MPTGGVQTDAEGFVEVKMLSLEAARSITQRLTSTLCSAPVSTGGAKTGKVETLVIYNETELNAVVLYRTMLTQLNQFSKEFAVKQREFESLDVNTNPKEVKVIADATTEAPMKFLNPRGNSETMAALPTLAAMISFPGHVAV